MPNLDYFKIFVLADAFEIPIYWLFFARFARTMIPGEYLYPAIGGGGEGRRGELIRFAKIAGLVTVANLCTHPVVFFGFMSSGRPILKSLLWAQGFSIFTEAVLMSWAARLPFGQTIVASAAANLFSWQFAALASYWLLI